MSPTLVQLSDDSGRSLTSSDFNLRDLTPDQKVEALLAYSSPEELDRFNQEARHANRHPELFALCPPVDEVRLLVTLADCFCQPLITFLKYCFRFIVNRFSISVRFK